MKLEELNRNEKLRRGISTGTCATAAALCAYSLLRNGKKTQTVSVKLPGGLEIDVPISSASQKGDCTCATVIKDAGDDPDVTDKAEIIVKARLCHEREAGEKDYLEPCGKASLIIRGGKGVGLCTKKGLDVPPGKYAINPAPRNLIRGNLEAAGFGKEKKECMLLEISVPNGETVAAKTLNPRLGIEGGISILGVSGIVEPYSNEAYIHSIRIQIRSIAESGIKQIAFTTGTRTQNAFLRDNPGFPSEACIRIGDFIADSLRAAKDSNLSSVSIACMPGKLYKYACGNEYTHAHKVALKLEFMAETLKREALAEKSVITRVLASRTVKEATSHLDPESYNSFMRKLAETALENMKKWNSCVSLSLHVYNAEGELLFNSNTKN